MANLTFPDSKNTEAEPIQPPSLFSIARLIPIEFVFPKLHTRFWDAIATRAVVLMPKTAIHEDDSAPAAEYQVRPSW